MPALRPVCAIVLAAGASRRMHAFALGHKLAARWGGAVVEGSTDAENVLERSLRCYTQCPLIDTVVLVLRGSEQEAQRSAAVRVLQRAGDPRLKLCYNPEPDEGMASSLRVGVQSAPADARLFVIGFADMPCLDEPLLRRLVQRWLDKGRGIVLPTSRGRRGHPVLIDARWRQALLSLRGDVGARSLLREQAHELEEVEVEDDAVLVDVDTPEAWRSAIRRGRPKVLVKGAGEHASGTAHRLFRCGFRVLMSEIAEPTAVRLWVSFCRAVFDGECSVEGVKARRCRFDEVQRLGDETLDFVPVIVEEVDSLVQRWRPDVIVDGRLLKYNLDNRLDDAPLTIALGPGIEAGREVHVVIETNRGHDLGRLIEQGFAAPDTGVPGSIGGYSWQRVLRAPCAGVLRHHRGIGDVVEQGELLCQVGEVEVRAPISGVLRGLAHEGLSVTERFKLGDIDPRAEQRACSTLSDKTRTISGGVLEAILARLGP